MKTESIISIFSISWYNIIGLYSLYKGSFNINGVHKAIAIHGIVCLINCFCSILELVNLDIINTSDKSIKYLRYIEWTICSPLMMLEMSLAIDIPYSQITPIIVLTVAFCLCGSIAAFSLSMWVKIFLGVQGTIYCFFVIFKMWSIAFSKRNNLNIDIRVGTANLIMASLIWPVFVITWGLGPDVYYVINWQQEKIAESISSFILKTFGLSYALIYSSKRIEEYINMMTLFMNRLT